jgi:hypothetical protein
MGKRVVGPALLKVKSGKNNLFLGNVGIGVPPVDTGAPSGLTVSGNISSYGTIYTAEGITSSKYVFSNNYLGTWNGDPLSGNQVIVEGIDLKSTGVAKDLFLKTNGDGTTVWDTIDDTEVYSETCVFTKSLSSGHNNLNTFKSAQFKTAKYVITLYETTDRTACEILVTHNGTNAAVATYGIVDVQATSLLTGISASVGTTINLAISTSGDCTAIINGVAYY